MFCLSSWYECNHLRVHASVVRRCLGSGKLPRTTGKRQIAASHTENVQPRGCSSSSWSSVECSPQIQPSVVQQLPMVKRIPKAAREQCSLRVTSTLEEVVRTIEGGFEATT